jgi:hypothetical protein
LQQINGDNVKDPLVKSIQGFYNKLIQLYYDSKGTFVEAAKGRKYYAERADYISTQMKSVIAEDAKKRSQKERFKREFEKRQGADNIVIAVQSGYATETAIQLALNEFSSGKILTDQDLIDIYRKQVGQLPFYKGGDVIANLRKLLGKEYSNIQQALQVKNLTKGAQLATFNTIINVLVKLKVIINDNSKGQKTKEKLIKKVFGKEFKGKANQLLEKQLDNITKNVEKEILDYFK